MYVFIGINTMFKFIKENLHDIGLGLSTIGLCAFVLYILAKPFM